MFSGEEWMRDWPRAEAFSARMLEICAAIPLRGAWEPDDRIAFAAASLRLTQEHQASVHLLIRNGRSASANALARPVIEAALRTIWLLEIASVPQIKKIASGRESQIPDLGSLNKDLVQLWDYEMSGKLQGLLHSFTHGGGKAMGAQFFEGEELELSNAVMVSHGGIYLCGAGFSFAKALGLQEIMSRFARDTPIVD